MRAISWKAGAVAGGAVLYLILLGVAVRLLLPDASADVLVVVLIGPAMALVGALAYVQRRFFPGDRAQFAWAVQVGFPLLLVATLGVNAAVEAIEGGSPNLALPLAALGLFCLAHGRAVRRRPSR